MKDRSGLVKLLALCDGTLGQLRLGSKSVAQWKTAGSIVCVRALEGCGAFEMLISFLVVEDSH